MPTLRNSQHSSLGTSRRQVVSSPAKSERMIRSNQIKLRPRRLSQDSGIVAGRLVGYAVSKTRISSKFSIWLYLSLLLQESPLIELDLQSPPIEPNVSADNIYNFLEVERQAVNQSPMSVGHSITPKPSLELSSNNRISSAAYTEKWLNSSMMRGSNGSFYQKVNSIAVPLPTHLETESAEPSPTQAFGPRIVGNHDEDIPGTAMRRTLGLNLSPTLGGRRASQADPSVKDAYEAVESSHSNVLSDQFGYKQLLPAERKTSTDESSINGSYLSSRKASKSNSLTGDGSEERRVSKQDREGLDPESLMFRDGRRKVDMVLAWEEEDLGVMTEAEARRRDIRRTFMDNLVKEGLEVELEDKSQSFNEKTFFLKIHLPWRLETRLAEVMNLKLPIKRFITISVKPSWVSWNWYLHLRISPMVDFTFRMRRTWSCVMCTTGRMFGSV